MQFEISLSLHMKFICNPSILLPAATKLGQGNIFTSVCQEFCPRGGRVSASVHAGIHPPGPGTPPTRHPPRPGTPPPPPRPGTPPPVTRPDPPPGPGNPRTRQTPRSSRPPSGSRLQHTVNERPVRILLEYILV